MVEKQLRCARCARQFPIPELKYGAEGTLLCMQCRGERPGAREAAVKATLLSDQPRKHYFCSSCGYHFTRASIVPTKCPYCAKETVVEEKQAAASRLLDE